MIIYYSKECGSCTGSLEIALMKTYCEEAGVEFMERRTIFWDRFEHEAEEISKIHNIKLPFFYATNLNKAVTEEEMKDTLKLKNFIREEADV